MASSYVSLVLFFEYYWKLWEHQMSIRHVSEQRRGSLSRWVKFSCNHFFQNVLEDYYRCAHIFHGGIKFLDLLDPKKVQSSPPLPPTSCTYFFFHLVSHFYDIAQDNSSETNWKSKQFSQQLEYNFFLSISLVHQAGRGKPICCCWLVPVFW